MIQDVHSAKISIGITAPIGTTVAIAAIANTWIYVHELMGDLAAAGTINVLAGARVLATFDLDAGQGLTESDEPGNDNVARFTCRPGEDFKLVVAGGSFTGTIDYSLRQ
jgi:hypothetical protein